MAEGQGKRGAASKAGQQHESAQVADLQQSAADGSGPEQASKHSVGRPAGHADAGPGTGVEAPPDETRRGQARMHVGAGHVAAPIEAPDAAGQTDPAEGHARSSTNPVAALVGRQTLAGENHVKFVGEDGNEVDPDSVFEPHGENQTSRVVRQGVFEVFNYQGSQQPMQRRLFYRGQRVDLATAARLADAQTLGHAQRAQEDARVEADAAVPHSGS